jgi:hypothetical protein
MARLTYNAQSNDADSTVTVDFATAKSIGDTLETWADGNVDRTFQRLTYDAVGGLVSISVRLDNVNDVDAFVTSINNSIDSLNTSHGTAFPSVTSDDISGR